MASVMMSPQDTIRDRYVISELLGESGVGRTWLAHDKVDDRKVVLKVLDFARLGDWGELELFRREVELLKSVDHPSIPAYVEDFTIEEAGESLLVLVQRFVPGRNLEYLVTVGRRFSIEVIRSLTRELLRILQYIHALRPQVIHRDVHPRNIVLDDRSRPHLVDFGAAGGLLDAGLSGGAASVSALSVGYVPPEQLAGSTTAASDLYALGMTVVFLLTGKDPADIDRDELRKSYRTLGAADPRLVSLLDGLTELKATRRIATAQKALEVLGGQQKKRPASPRKKPIEPTHKLPIWLRRRGGRLFCRESTLESRVVWIVVGAIWQEVSQLSCKSTV